MSCFQWWCLLSMYLFWHEMRQWLVINLQRKQKKQQQLLQMTFQWLKFLVNHIQMAWKSWQWQLLLMTSIQWKMLPLLSWWYHMSKLEIVNLLMWCLLLLLFCVRSENNQSTGFLMLALVLMLLWRCWLLWVVVHSWHISQSAFTVTINLEFDDIRLVTSW